MTIDARRFPLMVRSDIIAGLSDDDIWKKYCENDDVRLMFGENPAKKEFREGLTKFASEFRYGLGHYKRALRDYEKYIDEFGDDNVEGAATAHFEQAFAVAAQL